MKIAPCGAMKVGRYARTGSVPPHEADNPSSAGREACARKVVCEAALAAYQGLGPVKRGESRRDEAGDGRQPTTPETNPVHLFSFPRPLGCGCGLVDRAGLGVLLGQLDH